MSVVGPRPLTPDDIERFGWNHARYLARWTVAPGITGLAQLYAGRSGRLSWYLDRLYLRRHTTGLDAGIVVLSFIVNIVGKHRVRVWLRKRP